MIESIEILNGRSEGGERFKILRGGDQWARAEGKDRIVRYGSEAPTKSHERRFTHTRCRSR